MTSPLDDLEPVTDAVEIRKLIGIVGQVHVSQAVQRYTVALAAATRRTTELALGASPARLAPPGPGRQGAPPRSRAATTCCPTTCSGWPRRCSPTGCCPSVEAAMGGRHHGQHPGEHRRLGARPRGDPCVRPSPV